MPVQKEIKSHLARLLATEDLVVEHKNVPTAQFNVHTRVLILPLWEKASYDVYDMLVAHEVGHTLGLRHNFAGSLAANYPQSSIDELFKKYIEYYFYYFTYFARS